MSLMKKRKKIRPHGPDAKASWFVARLYSGEMTAGEEDELISWLEADPVHRLEYDTVLSLWDAAGELSEDPVLAAVGGEGSHDNHARRSRTRWIAALAAGLVFAVAISFYLAGYFPQWGSRQALESHQTAVGEQRVVTLADGSRLTLNTASRVLVDYTPEERRIILDYGEVFFDIEEDAQRPLRVSARGRLVTVLGTKFSVLLAGNDIRIAVIEGTVAVSREEERYPFSARRSDAPPSDNTSAAPSSLEQLMGPNFMILRAGTSASFGDNDEQVIENDSVAIERVQSWRSGLVRFEGEPLYRVVGELNRYSVAKILIEDGDIVNLPISGVFRLERVDLILSAIEDVFPVEVVRYSDRYVLVGSGTDATRPNQVEDEAPRTAH